MVPGRSKCWSSAERTWGQPAAGAVFPGREYGRDLAPEAGYDLLSTQFVPIGQVCVRLVGPKRAPPVRDSGFATHTSGTPAQR